MFEDILRLNGNEFISIMYKDIILAGNVKTYVECTQIRVITDFNEFIIHGNKVVIHERQIFMYNNDLLVQEIYF